MSRYARLVRTGCGVQAARSVTSVASTKAKTFFVQPGRIQVPKPNFVQIRAMASFGGMKQHPLSDNLVIWASRYSTLNWRQISGLGLDRCVLNCRNLELDEGNNQLESPFKPLRRRIALEVVTAGFLKKLGFFL